MPGYHLNRLDEPIFIAVSKPLLTEFGIHLRLESCGSISITTAVQGHRWRCGCISSSPSSVVNEMQAKTFALVSRLLFSECGPLFDPGWQPRCPPCCGNRRKCLVSRAQSALAWSLSDRTRASLWAGCPKNIKTGHQGLVSSVVRQFLKNEFQ